MSDKIVLNAMTVDDLQKMMDEGKLKLFCFKCKGKIYDTNGISGIIQRKDDTVTICKKYDCSRYAWENAMESPDV